VKLFDEAARVDVEPASHGEHSYAFLNRVASPYWAKVRAELEAWFAAYPAEAQPDVLGRFQSKLPAQHWGAWWELYLFTLFSRLGFAVEVHPTTGVRETSPDFRCRRTDCDFYLEAAVVFSGVEEDGRHAGREAWILDLVNKAKNPNFFVWLDFDQVGLERPRRSEVVPPIESWLAGLDADSVAAALAAGQRPPETRLAIRDWRMKLMAIPVKPEARGRPDHRLLGIGPMSSGYVNDRVKLGNSLERKFSRYGRLGRPLVVAVLAMSASVDRESVEGVLFGGAALQYSVDDPTKNRWIRQRDGVWIHERGPVAKAVSAVAVSSRLRPWTCAHELPELWLNPWSDEPLDCDLPFVTGITNDEGQTSYHDKARSASEIFNLPSDWPGPEPPFPRAHATGSQVGCSR
jgi:hypothetical protein